MAKSRPDWFVYSTLTNGTDFVEWKIPGEKEAGLPSIVRKVSIAGGANLANRKTLVTPLGVMTGVNNEDMDFLNNNDAFIDAARKGFITVVKGSAWPDDPDDVAKNLTAKDKSAPLTPNDRAASVGGKDIPQAETTRRRMRAGSGDPMRM